jgi:hypothetical protein
MIDWAFCAAFTIALVVNGLSTAVYRSEAAFGSFECHSLICMLLKIPWAAFGTYLRSQLFHCHNWTNDPCGSNV